MPLYPEEDQYGMPAGQQLMSPTPYQQQEAQAAQNAQRAVAMQNGTGQNPNAFMERAMNSPWAAMAGAGLQNMGAAASGRRMTQNPIQAYQSSVAAQANNRVAQDRLARQDDPYWAYEEGKRRGHIPQDMSYFDWRDQASGRSRGKNSTYAPTIGTDADGRKSMIAPEYDIDSKSWKTTQLDMPEGWVPDRSQQQVDSGSGIYTIDPVTGLPTNFYQRNLKPGETPETRGAQAAAVGSADSDTAQYTAAIDRTWANREAYEMATQFREASANTLKMIQDGNIDTGFIDGFMYNMFGVGTEELGAMNAEQVQAVLNNLQITNLAPVTEQELKTVGGLWADIAKQKAPNEGVLKRAIAKTDRLMERINADTKTQAERVKRYGGQEEYENLFSTNPFVSQQYEDDDPEIDI